MAEQAEQQDQLPDVASVLRKLAKEVDPEGRRIHRISIRLLSTGQVTYRMHSREHEDYIGGVTEVATGAASPR